MKISWRYDEVVERAPDAGGDSRNRHDFSSHRKLTALEINKLGFKVKGDVKTEGVEKGGLENLG
jgi:hypothetical protein